LIRFSLKLGREVENHSKITLRDCIPFDVVGRMGKNKRNADIPLMWY
jgi:hypothetical protein